MNSIRSLENALTYERERQIAALEAGETLVQETRHWNEDEQKTTSMRSKEEAFDYRYFPEPDIPPLEPDRAWVDEINGSLPELPAARRERYRESSYDLSDDQIQILAAPEFSDRFDRWVKKLGSVAPKMIANWLINTPEELRGDEAKLQSVFLMVNDGTISKQAGAEVLRESIETNADPATVVEARGLKQVSDSGELGGVADEVIAENPGPVEQFRGGKEGVIGFLVGQVMKKTGGSANPKVVQDVLRERLGSSS
jgi:aspartyl-tRNA(Asn)/glutamyl-tRNA(Gln) amidotransferase subunit B